MQLKVVSVVNCSSLQCAVCSVQYAAHCASLIVQCVVYGARNCARAGCALLADCSNILHKDAASLSSIYLSSFSLSSSS